MMNQGESNPTGTLLGGRYRVGQILGKGGMGTVYEAVQEDLGRRVAVKVLHPHLAFHPDALQRFRLEAQSAAALGHPNIVQITDFQANPAEPAFLVMEYLEGRSLAQAITQDGPLSTQRLVFVIAQMLSGLAAAHRANIVHRDIKPDNVFLTSTTAVKDLVKLLDFGIAKLQGDAADAHMTATGAMIGTPAYMSPEQARGLPIDARTDLYAVGACMYHALSGRLPFHANSLPALLVAIFEQPAAPLSSVCPGIDPRMEAMVVRAMAKDPAARFSSAEEMRAALAPFSAPTTEPPAARPPPPLVSASPSAYTTPPMPVAPMPVPVASYPVANATGAPRSEPGRGGATVAIVVGGVVLLAAIGGGFAFFAGPGRTDGTNATADAAAIAVGTSPTTAAGTAIVAPTVSAQHAHDPPGATRVGHGSPAASAPSTSTSTSTSTPTSTSASTSASAGSVLPRGKVARLSGIDAGVYELAPVRSGVEATMGAASSCFSRFPPPDNSPTFFVTVTATGAISAVGNANGASAPRNASLDQCMQGVFASMRLGRPTGAGFFRVSYAGASL